MINDRRHHCCISAACKQETQAVSWCGRGSVQASEKASPWNSGAGRNMMARQSLLACNCSEKAVLNSYLKPQKWHREGCTLQVLLVKLSALMHNCQNPFQNKCLNHYWFVLTSNLFWQCKDNSSGCYIKYVQNTNSFGPPKLIQVWKYTAPDFSDPAKKFCKTLWGGVYLSQHEVSTVFQLMKGCHNSPTFQTRKTSIVISVVKLFPAA